MITDDDLRSLADRLDKAIKSLTSRIAHHQTSLNDLVSQRTRMEETKLKLHGLIWTISDSAAVEQADAALRQP